MKSFYSFAKNQREEYDKASFSGGYYAHWNFSVDV